MINNNLTQAQIDESSAYSIKKGIKDAMETYGEHRGLISSSDYFLGNQKEAKRHGVLRATDNVLKGENYSGSPDYYKVNKDHPYFPISIRDNNKSFYPIRKLDMLNIFNKDDVWLAGGAIRSCLDGETPNDFDIFCKTKEAFHRVIEKFSSPMMRNNFEVCYISINEADCDRLMFNDSGHSDHNTLENLTEIVAPKRVSSNLIQVSTWNTVQAPQPSSVNPIIRVKDSDQDNNKNNIELVSFKSINDVLYKDFKIQVIYNPNNSDDLLTLMDDFDFTICQFGFDGEHFYYSIGACQSFQYKQININKINYPVSMLRRVSKYGSHGYRLPVDEARKLYNIISETDFDESNLIGYID